MLLTKKLLPVSIAALLALGSQSALANKSDDTLVYASNSWPENVSPYHNIV